MKQQNSRHLHSKSIEVLKAGSANIEASSVDAATALAGLATMDISRSFYLTLTSLIQSLAFGALLAGIRFSRITGGDITYCLTVATTLMVIIAVWHEYAMGATLFAWRVDYLDSAIPFLFGLVEFGQIRSIDINRQDLWCSALGCFGAVSFLAFYNQHKKAKRHSDNYRILKLFGNFHRNSMILVLICMIIFWLEQGLMTAFGSLPWIPLACAIASCASLFVFILRGQLTYTRILRELHPNVGHPR